jgi:hypothetical protein
MLAQYARNSGRCPALARRLQKLEARAPSDSNNIANMSEQQLREFISITLQELGGRDGRTGRATRRSRHRSGNDQDGGGLARIASGLKTPKTIAPSKGPALSSLPKKEAG